MQRWILSQGRTQNQNFLTNLTSKNGTMKFCWFDRFFLCSKYFIKSMIKNKKGIILNIASDLSIIAPDQRIYST